MVDVDELSFAGVSTFPAAVETAAEVWDLEMVLVNVDVDGPPLREEYKLERMLASGGSSSLRERVPKLERLRTGIDCDDSTFVHSPSRLP